MNMWVLSHIAFAIALATAGVFQGQPPSDVCSRFSAEDAARIMGGPMKRVQNRGANVCMYEEVTPKPAGGSTGTVALTLNRRSTAATENASWASLKGVRHLEVGQKNTKPLAGVGEEAWWTGNIEKGKIGVASVIARKGSSDFMLDVMVLDYHASPDALQDVAKKIAGGL
jgi:hypothetical protein